MNGKKYAGRKYLQIMSDKGLVSRIHKEFSNVNSKIKKKNAAQLENKQNTWRDIPSKRTCNWQISIWDAQNNEPSGQCQLKPQWSITTYLLGNIKLKKNEKT